MGKSSIEVDLEALLGESLHDASVRACSIPSLREDNAMVLYGAGSLGRAVLTRLRAGGIEPVAFADDTPGKQGTSIDSLPVMSPEKAVARFGERTVFVVTILNPALRFIDARRRLKKLTCSRVMSFLELAWQHSDVLMPYYQFELPHTVLQKARDIRRALNIWEDQESQRQFVAHLKFRLSLDYEALPENSGDDYFPPGVLPLLPDKTTFIDCGAYDGDTIQLFLLHQEGRFHEILAFEPDPTNYQKLRHYVSTLEAEVAGRIHIYNAGVGRRRTKMNFNSTGNVGAALDEAGELEVDVFPLDEVVQASPANTLFVKFDIEGGEWEALKGMQKIFDSSQPFLAISVYHRPDDLWQLPLYLKALNPAYRLFLRTQGEDGMDVICYALP